MPVHVLGCVGDQPVLTQGNDQVFRGEQERWHQAAIYKLHFQIEVQGATGCLDRVSVERVFAFVFLKIPACVLDIKPSLSIRIEAFDKLGDEAQEKLPRFKLWAPGGGAKQSQSSERETGANAMIYLHGARDFRRPL